ncbi:MAG: hydantoinase/oxoprolinase family protein [Oscillospiraceae bacterium]|jgi:N-methylhydantoinase A/oxoprolinase/acetone carboxylase beta subunit|nr:hydantoinase/oxoprolinase family protein [Oscillospiraceae bacterium]
MKIGIGIDTGGTYTDAVAYDFETDALLAKGKALTTRENLADGIRRALDMLPPEMIRAAALVSLSTTLATNACLEDKGGRAKMLIFGLNDELSRYDAEEKYGLKTASVRLVDTFGSADGLAVDAPDWDAVMREHGGWLADSDALSAAEVFAVFNGAPCEKQFKELAAERFRAPCVCAGELSSEVNVLIRSATGLLNARMFPIVREFVGAALADFAERGCAAPVMVVRSDGTLMSSELAENRPVETILSGPAASVLAGGSFCDRDDYVILDMGGTTTDVSVVRGGKPVAAARGIRLGGWQTSVRGVYVEPFALGGDSTIRAADGKLRLFPRRATPLCVAASRFPQIKPALAELLDRGHINRFPLHEFYVLVREPAEQKSYGSRELALIRALRSGPVMLENLEEAAGIDIYHFDGERLESEGVIMRCGVTPTDFMHLAGDFGAYDAEASGLAARYLLRCLGRADTPDELRRLTREAYDMVEGRLYENVLRVILAQRFPAQFGDGVDAQTEFLIRESWEKRGEEPNGLFRYAFGTKAALVGVGAPIHIFLPEVARVLGAECILPRNAEVANALGSLRANINAVARVDISQRVTSGGEMYYIVHAPTGSERYARLADASEAAKSAAETAALREARLRGASGTLRAETYLERRGASSAWGQDVSLGGSAVSEVEVRLR